MKTLMIATLLTLTLSAQAQAAAVTSATYNAQTQSLEIGLQYGGGCRSHKFVLQTGSCLETFPVRCEVEVVDLTTDDYCEAMIWATRSFPLSQFGLDDAYFNGAQLVLKGDAGSQATVTLPRR